MLIPIRMRLVAAIAVTAFAAICPAQDSINVPKGMTAADVQRIVDAAMQGDKSLVYDQTTTTERSSGRGAGMEATGDAVNTKVDSSAPKSNVSGGIGAEGGKLQSDTSAVQYQFSWLPILCWVAGVGCLAFAGWQFKLGSIKNATSFAVVGAAFIAVGFFPGLLLIGLAGIAVWLLIQSGVLSGIVGKTVQQAKAGELSKEALRAVAAGVSDLKDVDPVAHAKVLDLISRHADENDKATIKTVRRADDLN